jgi:spore coat protein CotH
MRTMLKRYFLFLFIAVAFLCCKKGAKVDEASPTPVTPVVTIDSAILTSVKIEAKSNVGKITTDITCTVANGEITALIPDYKAGHKFALTYTVKNKGTNIKNGDTLQVSGVTVTDFTKPVVLTVISVSGMVKTYTVKFKIFTGLPILYITSASAIVSKDVYVKGNVVIDANQAYAQDVNSMTMQIRGHGNSTWALSAFLKKPYRVKFDSKISMLGMTAAKNWVLLANYDDKTLMRNRIAMLLARRLGSDWAPDSRFVEVVLNGDFVGNYLLTPQVEVNKGRVDINELTDKNVTDADNTGGYLLELDQKRDADVWFNSNKGYPFAVKSPDVPTAKQLAYIKKYIQDTEDAIYSPTFGDPTTGYQKYINPDSFINWYLTNEIVQNEDARLFSSIFYYKDRNGKLGMGPVWDFDLSGGNIDYTVAQYPTGIWFIRDDGWFLRLAQDPAFIIKVRNRWAAIKDKEVKQIFADIDQTAADLKLSQQKNFERWPILSTYVWPNAVVLGSYDKEVAYYKDFLQQRINWIDANMASW